MPKLSEKIDNALEEARTLVLVAEVLIGFQYQSVFQKGFDRLPDTSKDLKVVALGLLLIALALLMAPAAFHRVVEEGRDTVRFNRFVTRALAPALLPFAIGVGIDFFVVTEKVAGQIAGIVSGALLTLVALFFWYALEALARRSMPSHGMGTKPMEEEQTPLSAKIKQVLTETRVVVPGVQALLGFQFAVMLNEGFDKLSTPAKYVHLASLALIAVSAILLLTPAAYHRIVNEGEDTEGFHTFASRMLLAAMVVLAIGLSGDFYLVVQKVARSVSWGLVCAALMLAFYLAAWFGYTLLRKRQVRQTAHRMAATHG